MHLSKPEIIQKILQLSSEGFTVRQIKALTGSAKNTISKYRDLNGADGMMCPCGQPLKHRGFCKLRYQRSVRRQLYHKGRSARSRDQLLVDLNITLSGRDQNYLGDE